MFRINELRPPAVLTALVVGVLTFSVVSHAVTTIMVPNAALVSYNLGPGANSALITPAANQPVLVMGCQLNSGFRGVGQVTMLRIPGAFLEWVGLESPAGATITANFGSAAGLHIVWIDFSHTVDLRVASADTFLVHNGNGGPASGNVKLIW